MVQEAETLTLYGVTREEYLEWLVLDSTSPSGIRWAKTSSSRTLAGSVFGCYSEGTKFPMWRGKVKKKPVIVARVLWFLLNGHPPKGLIDHRNGDTRDHSPKNLRDATGKVNNENRAVANPTGLPGVYLRQDSYGNQIYRCQGTRLDGKVWRKVFAVGKYGKEEACRMAISYRLEQERKDNVQSRRATSES